MQKKGEMTSTQITTLILLIAGFVILLVAIFFIIDIKSYSEDEVCRLSVLTRASAPDAAQRALPLKCTTGKICLNQNNEPCQAFIGEEGVNSISVPKEVNQAKAVIEATTAEAFYDCWNLMGQGKLSLFGGDKTKAGIIGSALGLKDVPSSCVVCSRVALSPSILANQNLLDNIDVNGYMANQNVTGIGETYFEAMKGENTRSYTQEIRGEFSGINGKTKNKTDEIGILFMQIETEKGVIEAGSDAAAYTGTFIFGGTAGVGGLGIAVSPYGILANLVSSATVGTIAAFQTWENRQVSAGYCGPLTTEEEALKGCSIVTGFDYHDIPNLRNFCGRVEGTP